MLEGQFKRKVQRFLDELPHTWHEKIQQRSIRGTPDILASIGGTFVALELKKSAKAKTDVLQRHKLEKIQATGATALLVYPENWAEVQRVLTQLSQCKSVK